MSFCKRCGANIGNSRFCPYCGEASAMQSSNTTTTTYQEGLSYQSTQQEQLRIQQEQLRLQQQQYQAYMYQQRNRMFCPRCHGNNVVVQAVAEQQKRGCFMSFLWVLLAIFTIGAIIWIPLLTKKGSKTRTYAVCQSCGFRWMV